MADVLLLDTNIASYTHPLRRGSAEFALCEPELAGRVTAISFQTVAELHAWVAGRGWGARRRAEFETFIDGFPVIPHAPALSPVWGEITAHARSIGRRLESGDAWIAAMAVQRRLTLLTHDRDFVGLNIPGLDVVCHADGGAGGAVAAKGTA